MAVIPSREEMAKILQLTDPSALDEMSVAELEAKVGAASGHPVAINHHVIGGSSKYDAVSGKSTLGYDSMASESKAEHDLPIVTSDSKLARPYHAAERRSTTMPQAQPAREQVARSGQDGFLAIDQDEGAASGSTAGVPSYPQSGAPTDDPSVIGSRVALGFGDGSASGRQPHATAGATLLESRHPDALLEEGLAELAAELGAQSPAALGIRVSDRTSDRAEHGPVAHRGSTDEAVAFSPDGRPARNSPTRSHGNTHTNASLSEAELKKALLYDTYGAPVPSPTRFPRVSANQRQRGRAGHAAGAASKQPKRTKNKKTKTARKTGGVGGANGGGGRHRGKAGRRSRPQRRRKAGGGGGGGGGLVLGRPQGGVGSEWRAARVGDGCRGPNKKRLAELSRPKGQPKQGGRAGARINAFRTGGAGAGREGIPAREPVIGGSARGRHMTGRVAHRSRSASRSLSKPRLQPSRRAPPRGAWLHAEPTVRGFTMYQRPHEKVEESWDTTQHNGDGRGHIGRGGLERLNGPPQHLEQDRAAGGGAYGDDDLTIDQDLGRKHEDDGGGGVVVGGGNGSTHHLTSGGKHTNKPHRAGHSSNHSPSQRTTGDYVQSHRAAPPPLSPELALQRLGQAYGRGHDELIASGTVQRTSPTGRAIDGVERRATGRLRGKQLSPARTSVKVGATPRRSPNAGTGSATATGRVAPRRPHQDTPDRLRERSLVSVDDVMRRNRANRSQRAAGHLPAKQTSASKQLQPSQPTVQRSAVASTRGGRSGHRLVNTVATGSVGKHHRTTGSGRGAEAGTGPSHDHDHRHHRIGVSVSTEHLLAGTTGPLGFESVEEFARDHVSRERERTAARRMRKSVGPEEGKDGESVGHGRDDDKDGVDLSRYATGYGPNADGSPGTSDGPSGGRGRRLQRGQAHSHSRGSSIGRSVAALSAAGSASSALAGDGLSGARGMASERRLVARPPSERHDIAGDGIIEVIIDHMVAVQRVMVPRPGAALSVRSSAECERRDIGVQVRPSQLMGEMQKQQQQDKHSRAGDKSDGLATSMERGYAGDFSDSSSADAGKSDGRSDRRWGVERNEGEEHVRGSAGRAVGGRLGVGYVVAEEDEVDEYDYDDDEEEEDDDGVRSLRAVRAGNHVSVGDNNRGHSVSVGDVGQRMRKARSHQTMHISIGGGGGSTAYVAAGAPSVGAGAQSVGTPSVGTPSVGTPSVGAGTPSVGTPSVGAGAPSSAVATSHEPEHAMEKPSSVIGQSDAAEYEDDEFDEVVDPFEESDSKGADMEPNRAKQEEPSRESPREGDGDWF